MFLFYEKHVRIFSEIVLLSLSIFSMVLSADSTTATVTADKNGFSIRGPNSFELQFKGYGQSAGYFGIEDEKKAIQISLSCAEPDWIHG